MRVRLHYAWIVAAITFVTLLASAGVRATNSVLILPFEADFGWDLPTVSLALSINLLLYGICGPFAGALMTRFGLRRVMLFGLGMLCIATGLSTLMTAAWQLDALWGVAIGVGSGSMALVLGAMVAARWFVARRGLVTGLFAASTATGQLVFLPLQARIIEAAGWRPAVLLVAGVALVVAVMVGFLMRDDPRQLGLLPLGASPAEADAGAVSNASARGNPFALAVETLRSCMRDKDFLLLAGSFAICGATTVGLISVHLIPASVEHGVPEVTAAGMLAAMGIFDLFGTTFSGWLSDRIDSRKLLVWYYGFRGLSLLFLPYAYTIGMPGLAGFVVFYGLDWVATVPPTVKITAERFGRERVGAVFGWIFAAHQLGGAFAAYAAGALHAWLGDYLVAFMSAGCLCLLAAVLVTQLGSTARARPAPLLPTEPAIA